METWDQLVRDMKIAVDRVFAPLEVQCFYNEEDDCIDYIPPFYLHNKCNNMGFGVGVEGDLKYPLTCTAAAYDGEFIVESKDDWINHADKIVRWHDECIQVIRTIRGN